MEKCKYYENGETLYLYGINIRRKSNLEYKSTV